MLTQRISIVIFFSRYALIFFLFFKSTRISTIIVTTVRRGILECEYYSRGFITLKLVFLLANASVRAYTFSELRLIMSMYSLDV